MVLAGKRIILVTSNEDRDDINKMIKLLENSGVLLEGVSKTLKREIKRQEGGFLVILLVKVNDSRSVNLFTG